MSLVGMLKQYATSGQFSNEATERVFSPLKRERQLIEGDNQIATRRRSEDKQKRRGSPHEQLQMISDLDEHEDNSEMAVEMLGLKDISDLGPPELPMQNDASFGEIEVS